MRTKPMTGDAEMSTFALDVYWASGRARDADVEAHLAGCARCRAYLASLDAVDAAGPPVSLPVVSPARAPRRRWALPAASALALAACFFLFARGERTDPDGYVGVKGTPAVQLLVHRNHDTRIWDGRSPLRPGDAVALRVACEGLKHLVVAAPGPAGWARLSAAPCRDRDDPLPFTLKVDGDPGEEKLAVVLSQDEMGDEALQRAIAEARRTPDVWVVSFVLPKETETDR